jgi:hypothetical protein
MTLHNRVTTAALAACLLSGLVSASAGATTITVPAGGDLQAAINAAQPGDTILVAEGATFVGPFTLPVKGGSDYITIRSSTADANLPRPGQRVDPTFAGHMPKLESPGSNLSVITTAPSAHHWRLLGLEISPNASDAYCSELVQLGDGSNAQNDTSKVPHDFIVDRCYIHSHATNNIVRRGVCLQCGYAEVRNCWISDIHRTDVDTQAIAGWNGPGPFVVDNNELEASGENILFGGGDPGIPNLVPSDITITNNHMFKPLSWRVGDPTYAGIHWDVKNLFEIKNAQRVTVDHNLFENNWADAQAGYAVDLKSSNQTGVAPWSVCQDVTFTNNIFRHSGSAIGIGRDTYPVVDPNHITFRNNIFEDIDGSAYGGDGVFLLISDATYVTMDHNTVFQSGAAVVPAVGDGTQMSNFVFTNNIVAHNAYGVKGAGSDSGTQTLDTYWPNSYTFDKNVLEGNPSFASKYPPDNFWPATWNDVGFQNYSAGNYALASTSPYHGAATDGTDIGYIGDASPLIFYSLTASPSQVLPAGSLTVSWTAPAGAAATDVIALYRVGDPNTSYLWYRATGGATSGTFSLSAPLAPGQYEFRYLPNNGFTAVARSNSVTVGVAIPGIGL